MGKTAVQEKDVVFLEVNGERIPLDVKEHGEVCLQFKNWRLLDIVKSERIRIRGK